MKLVEQIRDWNAKRRTRNILSDMSDAQLRDIGITRDGTFREARYYNGSTEY